MWQEGVSRKNANHFPVEECLSLLINQEYDVGTVRLPVYSITFVVENIFRSKREALDLKQKMAMMAYEFEDECLYLEKYLDDSIKLIDASKYLPAKMYSQEYDNYFARVNHTFYFSCSFVSMLMQIAEDLINQYSHIWNREFELKLKKDTHKPLYERFSICLDEKIGLNIDNQKWTNLCNLYQLRNAFIHQHGSVALSSTRGVAITALLRFKGIEIIDSRAFINEIFCGEALHIFKTALTYLFKATRNYINAKKAAL